MASEKLAGSKLQKGAGMMSKMARAWGLILFSILGIIGVLIYKSTKNTLIWIGPKSLAAFVICGILAIIGVKLLLCNKKK